MPNILEKIIEEKKYSLDLFKCLKCHLVQLGKVAPLKEMYGTTYGYRTGISNLMISHLKKKYNLSSVLNYLITNLNF